MSKCSDSELNAWSKSEGWSENAGRQLGRQYGSGVQIRYHPVDGQQILERRTPKCFAQNIEISANNNQKSDEKSHKSAFAASLLNNMAR